MGRSACARRLLGGWLLVAGAAIAATPCEELIEQGNAQLEAMAAHATAIESTLNDLNEALQRAERRNAEQAAEIERLQAELAAQRASDPGYLERLRRDFFAELRRRLPVSVLYETLPDRLVIANDPVFIFGKGEIGAEGRDRLIPVLASLKELVAEIPPGTDWRLRVEGHTDSRALRNNPRFDDNWELSSARALSLVQLLVAAGLPEDRLSAVGLADTQLRDPGQSSGSHRRNRRIEVRLELAPVDSDIP
jgi:chemotaxis protein MotB